MESFLTSYGLPFEEFRTLLMEHNAIVAGSAALTMYLKQEEIDPGFEPADLDIWVEETHDTWYSNGKINTLANSTKFCFFLVKHGYNLTMKFDNGINDHYYRNMTNIKHIFHFINSEKKEIQLIMVRETNLVQYIYDHFDLTACISWWNAESNSFRNSHPGLTCKKELYVLPNFTKDERTLERVEKYKARGFTIYESPCPHLVEPDTYECINRIEHEPAFDVFAYEDVACGHFLRESTYHVLLYIGEQFYAYSRKQLQEYLQEHSREYPDYGTLCELPHKQLVSNTILSILPYSDYSIIQLKQVVDNIYCPEYYTTQQWANKTPARHEFLLPSTLSSLVEPPGEEWSRHRTSRQTLGQLRAARIARMELEELAGLTESLQRSGLPVIRPAEDAVRLIMQAAIARHQ